MSLAQAPEFYGVEGERPMVATERKSATPDIENDRWGWPLVYATLGVGVGPWGVVTAAPLAGVAEHVGSIIAQLDLTSASKSIVPLVRAILVAEPVDLQSLDPQSGK